MAWIRCTGNTGGSLKVRTASGQIATFETNMVDVLQSVKCEINATGGNGTPDSPNPIVGYTEANITRCGVNLADFKDGYSVAANGEIEVFSGRAATVTPIRIDSDKSYVYASDTSVNAVYAVWNGTTLVRRVSGFASGGTINTSGGTHFYIAIYAGGGASVATDKPQVIFSTESTEYHAYNGQTYTIAFGQTVYGGVLDVTRGKLTVTSAYLALNGSENWTDYAAYNGFQLVMSDMKSGNFMDGKANYLQTLAAHGHGIRFGANNNLIYCEEIITDMAEVSDLATWKTYLSTHNLEIVYPLATPFDIDLTPVQIEQLLGKNNVWHDANGDTEVKFLEVVRN